MYSELYVITYNNQKNVASINQLLGKKSQMISYLQVII